MLGGWGGNRGPGGKYRRVYGFGHLQADCRGPGSAPEPYTRFKYGTMYVYLYPSYRSYDLYLYRIILYFKPHVMSARKL